jgi:hypothetical protein
MRDLREFYRVKRGKILKSRTDEEMSVEMAIAPTLQRIMKKL